MIKNISLIVALVVLLSACSNLMPSSDVGLKIIDAFGREVEFSKEPEKIIIAGRQTPMLANFFYLFQSESEKIIAIENRSQSVEEFLTIIDPDIQSKYQLERGAGAEQIAPFNPDVVILKTSMRESIGFAIEKIGIPVVYVEFESIDQIYRDLGIIAEILGEEERGDSLIQKYQKIISDIDKTISESASSSIRSVLIVQAENLEEQTIFSVPAGNWLQTSMIEELGAIPVWKESTQSGSWAEVNIEQILNWNPDYLFVINYQGNARDVVESIFDNQLWKTVTAVKNDKVFAFPYDFISWDQPDSRFILGYAWLAWRLFPEQIDSEYFSKIVETFYLDFYGLDKNSFNEYIFPRIHGYIE